MTDKIKRVTLNFRCDEKLANELRALDNYSAFIQASIEKNLNKGALKRNILHINGERHVVYCETDLKDIGIRFTGQ